MIYRIRTDQREATVSFGFGQILDHTFSPLAIGFGHEWVPFLEFLCRPNQSGLLV